MSIASLAVVAIAPRGHAPAARRGIFPRVWQLLIAGQMPLVGYFIVRWLPLAPRQGVLVAATQLAAGLLALSPVFLLNL